jgi:ABC-2 type transport system permease protein
VRAAHVLHLGIKEFYSLWRDPIMLVLIIYVFTFSVYTRATAIPEPLNKAPIAFVEEDRSPLSARIASAFYPHYFLPPMFIDQA